MKKLIILLIAVATIGFSGCEKWLDINQNPNDATKANPDLILPGVLKTWATDVPGLTTTTGSWMGYWYHAGGWSGWYDIKKYEVTAQTLNLFNSGTTVNNYYTDQLTDTRFIRANSGDNVVFPAITDVVDTWYYARLIDCYGDVPYSEACQPDLTLTPKYDDAETIWLDLISRLDNAITTFDNAVNAPDAATNPIYTFKAASDIVYSGNFTNWKKFANTLKLRLVMRLTNVKTTAELKAMMDNTVAHGFITANVSVNPGYSSSDGKTNPWWNTFGKSFSGTVTTANTQYVLNTYLHEKLVALADPRLEKYFFAPASAVPAGTLISRVLGVDGDLESQPNSTVAGNYSWVFIAEDAKVVNRVKDGNGALDRAVIMIGSEAYFLQAEAAARGIITTVTAQAAYEGGIQASMAAVKVLPADVTTYLGSVNIAWNGAWSTQDQVKRIIDQKYIANYFLNMFESYSDYRRTGYPNPKHPTFINDPVQDPLREMLSYYPGGVIRRQIPRIWPYPQTDINTNEASAMAAINAQIQKNGVTFNTSSYPFDARVFWDTAPKTIGYDY